MEDIERADRQAELAELRSLLCAHRLELRLDRCARRGAAAIDERGKQRADPRRGEEIARRFAHRCKRAGVAGELLGDERLQALGDRLYGIRLDTPAERGRVTADLVHEVRARLDQEGYHHVKITVSGGLDPDRIRYFKEAGAPVDSYAVGSYISGATPIDFTGDIKEVDGRPIAKRGRIPGVTESPRLKRVDLAAYRELAAT